MKYNRRNIFMRLNKHIFIRKKFMFYSGFLMVLVTGVTLISPFFYKILVDDVMYSRKLEFLYWLIPCMSATYIFQAILSGIKTYCDKKFFNITILDTKNQIMTKILARDISQSETTDVGRQSGNIENDSLAVYSFVSGHIVQYVSSLIIAIVYFILMLFINPWLALLSTVMVPISIWFSDVIGKKYNKIQQRLFEIRSIERTHLFTTIQKWREIKVNTLEDKMSTEYDEKLELERCENLMWMRIFGLRGFFYTFKNNFVLKVMLYFIGGAFIIYEKISIGSLLMFMSYMESMSGAVDAVMKSNADFKGQQATFERLFKILEERVYEDGKDCPENPEIALSNVDFVYTKSNKVVLSHVNCFFEYGKKYLIVGRSGEGKSTFIKLLLGINKVTSGELTINGGAIDKLNSESLHQKIGAVMQETMFFNLSIRENLQLIAPLATDEEIDHAIKLAHIDEFIESLPNGLDTMIGERGVKLSGGQKQRLALARVILHNPEIIILDEATSALDSVIEAEIFENLNRIFANKTLIIISHKPISCMKFDCIYRVMESKMLSS